MGFIPRYTRSTTLVVAASDSKDAANADYVCDGTDDQVDINAAITALGAIGGMVLLLDGTYDITGDITLDTGTALVGQGAGTVLAASGGANLNIVSATTKDHVLVANLKIDGSGGTGGAQNGIRFLTVTNSEIVECWVENLRNQGIALLLASHNNTITGNNSQSNGTYGIHLSASHNNTITGNNFQSNGGYGIHLTHSHNNTVTGNNHQSNAHGMNLDSCNNNTITGNNFQSNGGYGILLSFSRINAVTGNNFQSNDGHGIYLWQGWNNSIMGNICQGNNLHGIYVRNESSWNTIVGNTVTGNSQTTDNTDDGIHVDDDSDYNNIQGNTVRHAGLANQHRYGIRINNANCDGNFVHGNDLWNAGRTLDYSDAGTGTIYHNNRTTVGWVP